MIRWFLRRKLDTEEKKLGESMDYLRHIVDVSPTIFFRFASIMPFANSRNVLPKEAWFVAQLLALEAEDCGPCLQITVNLALEAGVERSLIQSVLDNQVNDLSDDLQEVFQFTKLVLDRSGTEDTLREKLRQRYGDRGLIELSYAIAASRIPPTVKRTLGYAKSCSNVSVEV